MGIAACHIQSRCKSKCFKSKSHVRRVSVGFSSVFLVTDGLARTHSWPPSLDTNGKAGKLSWRGGHKTVRVGKKKEEKKMYVSM